MWFVDYSYMHTYTHAHMYAHIHTHACTHTHSHTHSHTHTHAHTHICTHRMAWFKLWKTIQTLVQSLWGDMVCMCGETPGKVQKWCEWYLNCLLSSSPHTVVGHLSNLFPSAGVSAMTTYLSLLYGVELTQPNYNEILLCNVYHIVQVFLARLL